MTPRVFARIAAACEYYFRPSLRDPLGGPFNGQRVRQSIFAELMQIVSFRAVVETGTYRGTTTEFIAENTRLPIWTVESRPRFYYFARMRLANRGVTVTLGDSRSFLRALALDTRVPKTAVFFYLDAHWYEDLPLLDEITIITEHWSNIVIMVDDFEVPDDTGYGFDDYGEGKRLSLGYLGPVSRFGLQPFFPRQPSNDETGLRRGCVVLADQEAARRLMTAKTLRLWPNA